jgi:LysR family cyn operon transcriptional activator
MENVADFGLTQLPVAEKRVQIVDIYRDEIRCVVPAGHPLADAEKVTCEEILPYSLLLPAVRHYPHAPECLVRKSGRRGHADFHGARLHRNHEAVCHGRTRHQFSFGRHRQEEVNAGLLRSIPLAPEPMVRKLGLIYRKDKALSKAALGFIQVMLAHFGSQNAITTTTRQASPTCRRMRPAAAD